jgi:hypothetical protein
MQKKDRGKTRWRRCFILLLPALLGVGILTIMTIQGVLPLHLAVTGQDFKLSSNGGPAVASKGLTAYPSTIEMKDGEIKPVLVAGLPEATLEDGMCLSLVLTFPFIGTNTLQIHTSGETVVEDMKASAAEMYIKGASLKSLTKDGEDANADGSNVESPGAINMDASEIGGHAGNLGLSIPGVVKMGGLQATAKGALIAGTAKLNGIGIPKIAHGRGVENNECY